MAEVLRRSGQWDEPAMSATVECRARAVNPPPETAKKGKNKYSVKNVIRNKIVARAFAVIKRNSGYVDTHAFAA